MNNRGRPPKRNVSAFFEQQQPAPTAPRGNGPNSPAPTNGPNSPAATNEYMPNSPAAMNVSAVPTVAPPTEEQSLNAFFEARQNANANLVNMKPKKGYIPGLAGLFANKKFVRQMGQRNLIFGNAMANLRQRQAANAANAAKPAKPFWKRMFGLGFKNKSRKNRKNKSRKNRKSRKGNTRRS